MKSKNILYLVLLCALSACNSNDDELQKDTEKPIISELNIVANPIDCQVYHPGDVIPFHYIMTDNLELGAYNIEVHNNFDHHTHSTTAIDCPLDPEKQPQHPWVFNKDYEIPAGLHSFDARHDIQIPTDIDCGDYHFMIRLTDRAGWRQIHAVAIKIAE